MMKHNRGYKSVKIFIILFLIISIVLPLLGLIVNIRPDDFVKIISSPQFQPMVLNSLLTTTIATCISTSLAFLLAWCIHRSHIRYKSFFSVLLTLPMFIPSISHGTGLLLLLGDNGFLTNILGINVHLYGYTGIILGSILYSFPVAFLMLMNILRYEDYTTYEAAQVLGLSKFQQFKAITLPYMTKPLIAVIFAVFTMIITDYGVPLVVGGKVLTLPVYMYREVIGLLDFSKGTIIGLMLLIPAFIAFVFDVITSDVIHSSTIVKLYKAPVNKKRDCLSYSLCILMSICICAPLLLFLYLSFVKQYPIDMSFSLDNIKKAFQLGMGVYLESSLVVALLTSFIGVGITYITAFITSRSKHSFSNLALHLISMMSLAIPGIVLGLCYVFFFKGSFIYGSVMILVLVNITHFFASPYLLAFNSLSKFHRNLEDVSSTLGISKLRMLWDIYIPSTKETIIEMFSYMFVNAMVTISAVSFLANFRNLPLSLLIPQFDSQSLIEATAFISIVILIVNVGMKGIIYFLKKIYSRNI